MYYDEPRVHGVVLSHKLIRLSTLIFQLFDLLV